MIPVKQIMRSGLPVVTLSESVESSLKIMDGAGCDYLLIGEEGELRGVVTSRELLRYPPSRLLMDCNRQQVVTVSEDLLLDQALQLLMEEKADILVVSNHEAKPVGWVSKEIIIFYLYGELKKANRHLMASRESFHNIVENSADGIMVTDVTGTIRFVNLTATRIFGRKAEDLTGQLFGFAPVSGESAEIEIIRRGGETGIGEMRVSETEWDGEPASLVLIRDITERKKVEALELLARRQAEDTSRAKSAFVANVSHELRTPLTSMRNVVSNIQAGGVGEIKGPLKEYMEMLDGDCRRLCELIETLLDMSRIESGKMSFDRVDVQLREVAEKAVLCNKNAAQAKNISVKLEIPASAQTVYADEKRIAQVFVNLLANAVKWTPEGGAVTIRAQERDQDMLVSVADTGIGIAPSDHERIFETFVQVGRQAGQGEKGTGLGLAICKEIVSLHGGRIWVQSAPGKGSTFFFSLPKAQTDFILKEELTSAIERAKAEDSVFSLVVIEMQENGQCQRSDDEALQIIREASRAIKACFRNESDVVTCCENRRIACVLPGVGDAVRSKIESRLAKQLQKHEIPAVKSGVFSMIIGGVTYPQDGATAADLAQEVKEKLHSPVLAGIETGRAHAAVETGGGNDHV